MKKLTILILLLAISSVLFSQKLNVISYVKWSDPTTYQLSQSPKIQGYGYYSDSLSKSYNGATFYEFDGEYYRIESWADYYFWFVKKHWHLFSDGSLYEYYYLVGDNFGMASYIASHKYRAKHYPSLISIDFEDKIVRENRLASNSHFISNEKDQEKLEKKLVTKSRNDVKSPEEKSKVKTQSSPELFNKDKYRQQNIETIQKPKQTETSRSTGTSTSTDNNLKSR